MTEEQKRQAKKLLLLKNEPTLAIFDELQIIQTTLDNIANKEMTMRCEHKCPEMPPMPEIPKTDMTQTNELLMTTVAGLSKILEALQKVEVTLEIDED